MEVDPGWHCDKKGTARKLGLHLNTLRGWIKQVDKASKTMSVKDFDAALESRKIHEGQKTKRSEHDDELQEYFDCQ